MTSFRRRGACWRVSLAPNARINDQAGTTYTLVATDEGKTIVNSGSAALVVTIPPNSSVAYPVGAVIKAALTGSGSIAIVGGSGVNIPNSLVLNAPGQMVEIQQRSVDNWIVPPPTALIKGRVVTAATTVTDADTTIVFNGAGSISQALPAATAVTPFKVFQLTNIGSNAVTLTDTIAGTANRTINQWATTKVFSSGSVWLLA